MVAKYLTMQDIFNGAYIQAQRKIKCVSSPSYETAGNCLYRNLQKECCFIGALIPNELYNSDMENRKGNRVLIQANLLPEIDRLSEDSVSSYYDYESFITQLQKVHDSFPIETWNGALTRIAEQYNLQVPNIPTASVSV